jgi:two-component system OmpR family response regulator
MGIDNMYKVLAIEDDELLAQRVVCTLSAGGLSVEVALTGHAGVMRVMAGDYDAVVLDRAPPDLDGVAVVSALRANGVSLPVLMISLDSDVCERIEGLRAGADDYLSLPFSSEEMLARMEVLLRRRPVAAKSRPVLHANALELDLVARKMTYGPSAPGMRAFGLQPTEFRLLEFLMRNVGEVLTRTMIHEAVWERHFDPGTNRIDVHVGRLRKKIDALGAPPMIRTIRGHGYRFG